MASTFTNTLVRNITSSATTLYTSPISTQVVIVGLSIANTTTSSITMDVYIENTALNYYLVKGAVISPGNSLIVVGADQKVTLKYGDVLKALSSAATSADAVISLLTIA